VLQLPPLSLYVHLPWCVAKCPYCDFNSYALDGQLPEQDYVQALLADLESELPLVWGRTVHSVFLGGGTPSLFSAQAIEQLLSGIRARLSLAPDAEITMEANPGTAEHDRFGAYRAAGINRLSLGIQSFDSAQLRNLGRIHDGQQAERAIELARAAGFTRLNLDLMWALPGQRASAALEDLHRALAYAPEHLSYYELTIEPNTRFAAHPPALPGEADVEQIETLAQTQLGQSGFEQYEISAWCQPGGACRHNVNYWRYGDYLGIGAGAHGKLTSLAEQQVVRSRRKAHPRPYLKGLEDGRFVAERYPVDRANRVFEYFLNRFRLSAPVMLEEFAARTGAHRDEIEASTARAVALGLLEQHDDQLIRTDLGRRCLNDLTALFLPNPAGQPPVGH